MSLIERQDKNGVKPLLQTGEFGYDNYPAGGDSGRVYVGTGSVNIPLAKKAEMLAVEGKADVHIARVDNPHGVTKAQVGLGNADNTADINKIVASAGRLTAGKKINNVVFDNTQDITIKSETPNKVIVKFDGGATEGADIYTFDGSENKSVDIVAGLNVQLVKTPGSVTINVDNIDASKITSGVIDSARLPSYVDDVLEFSSLDDFPLVGETGKIYVAINTNKTYRWSGTSYVYITSGGAVDSVAGKTGVVILNKDDVGLNQVDNTSDVNKPISTATANALALKAGIESPAFTGEPKAPTAAIGTNSTQLATTAFVGAEIVDKTYSKTQLNAGQLDNRYYTETEIDTLYSTTVKLTGNQTIAGIKTFSSNIVGNITGNASTATTLSTARTINGVAFDGTANIVAPTNLGITAGTTAGPIVTSSTGTNATLPTASATASGVMTTGAQTIAGIKTFSSSPIVPTPTTDTQATNKVYVDSKYSGFKNYIINGGFDIWQRGTSISGISAASAYRADRWFFRTSPTGASNLTTYKAYSSAVGTYLNYSYTSSTSGHYFRQQLENPVQFSNKTMTVSIDVYNCSVEASFSPRVLVNDGTSDVLTLGLGVMFTTHTEVLPNGIRYSSTFTVPDLSSYNLTSSSSFFSIGFNTNWVGTGSFRFGKVQLEEGSVATPFEQRPIGLELSLCQRYYQKHFYTGTISCVPLSALVSNVARGCMTLPTEMRTFPTCTITGDLSKDWTLPGLSTNAPTSIIVYTGYPGHIFIDVNTTGLTVGQAGVLRRYDVSGTGPALILDAEL